MATITTGSNYHLARINQPDMKEAPAKRHFVRKEKARSRGGAGL